MAKAGLNVEASGATVDNKNIGGEPYYSIVLEYFWYRLFIIVWLSKDYNTNGQIWCQHLE